MLKSLPSTLHVKADLNSASIDLVDQYFTLETQQWIAEKVLLCQAEASLWNVAFSKRRKYPKNASHIRWVYSQMSDSQVSDSQASDSQDERGDDEKKLQKTEAFRRTTTKVHAVSLREFKTEKNIRSYDVLTQAGSINNSNLSFSPRLTINYHIVNIRRKSESRMPVHYVGYIEIEQIVFIGQMDDHVHRKYKPLPAAAETFSLGYIFGCQVFGALEKFPCFSGNCESAENSSQNRMLFWH
uniref:Uncharacterized protein n=1 Tax=Romanomermis culicivorax TaxID=13658 RepID=A0A915I436_ROMCU